MSIEVIRQFLAVRIDVIDEDRDMVRVEISPE